MWFSDSLFKAEIRSLEKNLGAIRMYWALIPLFRMLLQSLIRSLGFLIIASALSLLPEHLLSMLLSKALRTFFFGSTQHFWCYRNRRKTVCLGYKKIGITFNHFTNDMIIGSAKTFYYYYFAFDYFYDSIINTQCINMVMVVQTSYNWDRRFSNK